MLKRHEIQVLRRAEHTWSDIAVLSGVSEKTARRIAAEDPVITVDNAGERARRQVGRPSKAEAYREVLVQALTEDAGLRSVELLHRARLAGYTGGKSAVYALAQTLRTRVVTPLVRFEGHARLPLARMLGAESARDDPHAPASSRTRSRRTRTRPSWSSMRWPSRVWSSLASVTSHAGARDSRPHRHGQSNAQLSGRRGAGVSSGIGHISESSPCHARRPDPPSG